MPSFSYAYFSRRIFRTTQNLGGVLGINLYVLIIAKYSLCFREDIKSYFSSQQDGLPAATNSDSLSSIPGPTT